MSCWEILGIEQTGNQETIRQAYLNKLPQFHPEEDPKGFQILRTAMEEAMREAAGTGCRAEEDAGKGGMKETDMMDSRSIRSFLKEVQEIYQDFGRRILPDSLTEAGQTHTKASRPRKFRPMPADRAPPGHLCRSTP